MIGEYIPEEYKGYFHKAGSYYDYAMELKAKKDEMQISLFEKLIDPLWSKFDTEGKGYITHDQCKVLMQKVLKQTSYYKYYNNFLAGKLLEQFDPEGTKQITRRQAAEVVNNMVLGGI